MLKIKDNEFNRLADFVQDNYGIVLLNKKNLIESRLSNIIYESGYKSFGDFLEQAYDNKNSQIALLIDKITTNHTFFMREPMHFDFYKDKILPSLKSSEKDNDLRVWSAGCSSGEEPYTIAMINSEYFGNEKVLWDTRILATDLSQNVLEKAKKGVYTYEDVENLSPLWKLKYFKNKSDNTFEITKEIKKDVIFRKFNLMESTFPFKRKFHVIFCRNVMMYFDNATRCELINKFYECTERGGYLFIGHSETINRDATKYKYVMPAIYRKEWYFWALRKK